MFLYKAEYNGINPEVLIKGNKLLQTSSLEIENLQHNDIQLFYFMLKLGT